MSAIIWCDSHNGPFSENEVGWAYLEVNVRVDRQGHIERETRHFCKNCTEKMLNTVVNFPALESGSGPKADSSEEEKEL